MDCVFNNCELLKGLILGIIPSIIIAWLTSLIVNRKNQKDLKTKFGRAEGKYIGFGFKPVNPSNPHAGNKTILDDTIISKAEIVYQNTNRLTITLQHQDLIWTGELLMESETFGTISWRYINMPLIDGKEQHWFGLKRCIIRNVKTEDKAYVYLIGDQKEGYGKEVLVRDKTSNSY